MAPPEANEDRSAFEDAKKFLRDLLADGPVSSKQVKADADGAGYAWRTMQRAQQALGVEAVKPSMKGGWVSATLEERQTKRRTPGKNLGGLR